MNQRNNNDDVDPDWVEWLTSVASQIGFNPIRVRWKLTKIQTYFGKMQRAREVKREWANYEHKTCPNCGHVVDREAQVCPNCESVVESWRVQRVARLSSLLPKVLSATGLVGLLILIVYARLVIADPANWFGGAAGEVMFAHGALWKYSVNQGEWWRLGTHMMLHFGLIHLAFNLYALSVIGPGLEEVFGRGRLFFFFGVTGVCAALGSYVWYDFALSAGASGAIMGLIGVGVVWSHRTGTGHGRHVRNQLLRWVAYIIIFGLFINADNAAHVTGLLAGGLLGLLPPEFWKKPSMHTLGWFLNGLGIAIVVVSFYLALFPPASDPRDLLEARFTDIQLQQALEQLSSEELEQFLESQTR